MTRPLNLFIVMLTMVCSYLMLKKWDALFVDLHFMCRVLSAVCIAAAGNIINDYFDRKVDLINKPHRTYVDISVKRRVAIASHVLLNIVGIIAGWMGCRNGHGPWLICPLMTLVILWWYSAVLKKKFLVGNISVAVCTACVPLWAICNVLPTGILIAAWFALLTTLLREIVKDAEDYTGDHSAGFDTLAVRYGISKTQRILQVMTIVLIFLFVVLTLMSGIWRQQLFFIGAAAGLVLFYFQIRTAHQPEHFGIPSRTLKMIMLAGVLLLPWVFG